METYAQKAHRLALIALERGKLFLALELYAAAGLSATSVTPLDFN